MLFTATGSPRSGAKRKLALEDCSNTQDSPKRSTNQQQLPIKYATNGPKALKLNTKLAKLVVSKSLPLALVEAPEFIDWCAALDPKYKVPCSSTIRNTYVPNLHSSIKTKLQDLLQLVDSCNISSDIWTDGSARSFLAFCVHAIDNDWQLVKGKNVL